jgi:hypothetical protein
MLCVSLDQNFLSAFAKGKPAEAVRLHALLAQSVTARKAVCPLHAAETVFETALCPAPLREQIFGIARELAIGVGFRNFGISAAIETLQLGRPALSAPVYFPDKLEYWIDGDLEAAGIENRAAKRLYEQRVASLLYPPPQYSPTMPAAEVLADIVTVRVASMVHLIKAIKERGEISASESEWEVAGVIAGMLLDFKVTPAECDQILHAILHHKWENTPTLYVHSLLSGQLEWDCLKANRQTKANDHSDFWRLAIALNYADVVFCDAAMRALVQRTMLLEDGRATAVFSFRQIPEAIAYLERRLA